MDTIWFNEKWIESEKSQAKFYRVYSKTDSKYLIFDKYLNHRMQMFAEAKEIRPLTKEGYCVYFNQNGTKESRGFYDNNIKVGTWVKYFENEKDSSLYEVMKDGSSKYIYKSLLQKDDIYTIVETQAEYPGGVSSMISFIRDNTEYPASMRKLNVGGKAILKFIINEQGDINSVDVIKGTGVEDLDNEAVRVVRSMPQWKPATMTGKAVKCYFNIPFRFGVANPYFIFEDHDSENCILAKTAILNNDFRSAIDYYMNESNNIAAKFNLGVIYYLKNSKSVSKKYFEYVKKNCSDQNSQYFKLSDNFLTNYFN